MVALIVAAHGALAYGLLQVREVRDMAAQVAPMFVSLVEPAPEPVPPAPVPIPPPKPVRVDKPVIAAAPEPVQAPTTFTVPEPPPEPVVHAEPAAAPTPAPAAPAPAPRFIPASAVQYVEPPVLVYPRASRRAGESGRVVLRVFIDEAGLPRQVQVTQSAGFPRLDDAAISAVQKARFKPYSENGQPVAGWALVPLSFDLEK